MNFKINLDRPVKENFYRIQNLEFCKVLIKRKTTDNLTKNGKMYY